MAELFDKDGNPVEGALTQEELEAKIAAEKEAWEEEQKKANPPEQDPEPPKPAGQDEAPEWVKSLIETMNNLQSQVGTVSKVQTQSVVGKYAEAVEQDKRSAFEDKYNSLTGYDDTPEGMEQRAADAYLLTTGQRYEESGVDMRGFTGAGKGAVDVKKTESADVAAIDAALGITPEDAEKYGKKE